MRIYQGMAFWEMVEKAPYLDQLLYRAFASINPPLAHFPHRLFRLPDASKLSRLLQRSTGARAGVFGCFPVTYLDNNELSKGITAKDFRTIWGRKPLQDHLQQFLCEGSGEDQFRIAIAVNTPPQVIDRMLKYQDSIDPHAGCYHYYDYMLQLAAWLPDLGWGLLPLEFQSDYCLFATSQARGSLVARLDGNLHNLGISTYFIRCDSSRCHWPKEAQ